MLRLRRIAGKKSPASARTSLTFESNANVFLEIMLMRLATWIFGAVFALAAWAAPTEAQVKLGVQATTLTSIDDAGSGTLDSGTFGLGARAMIDPPLSPISGFVSGTYYFPGDDLNYWTATAAAQIRAPLPVVKPYALVGWQLRRTSFDSPLADDSSTDNGPVLGAGVQFDLGVSLFIEGTYEFTDGGDLGGVAFDDDPIVIKGGIMLGGR